MLAGVAGGRSRCPQPDHPDTDEEATIQFAKMNTERRHSGFDQETGKRQAQITGRPAEGRKQAWTSMVRNALPLHHPDTETGKQHRIEVFSMASMHR